MAKRINDFKKIGTTNIKLYVKTEEDDNQAKASPLPCLYSGSVLRHPFRIKTLWKGRDGNRTGQRAKLLQLCCSLKRKLS